MKPFLAPKRRLIELAVLVVLNVFLYFFWESWPMVCLFSFGFIWNWTAAQDLSSLMDNPRYKFSMVKFVGNVQQLTLKPFQNVPRPLQSILKSIPAGVFWAMVVFINDSVMPWWMTFVGSGVFEILQFEISELRKDKESVS